MAHLGLRASCFSLPAAPYFFSNAYTIFEHPSGLFGARGSRTGALPPAETYLRQTVTRSTRAPGLSPYAKFRRLGSVWSVPSKAALSAATIAFKLEQEQTKALEDILSATSFLRSTPLASTTLVAPTLAAQVDREAWDHILVNLIRIPHDSLSATLRAVASEIELALEMGALHVPELPTQSSPVKLHTADQMSRHNKFNLFLDDFPAGRVAEKDYSLLAAKLLENPDFPVVPPWHEEFYLLRPWFNVALELSEDYPDSDIFAHEILLRKVFPVVNKYKGAPPAKRLRAAIHAARRDAPPEAEKMMQAELNAAALLEPGRLLQVKIEDLIPDVAKTEEEHKALRKISLKELNIPRILESDDRSVILLLQAKMRAILRNSKHVADVDDTCICDIISEYSDDEGEHHFNGPVALKNIFPERKRNIVLGWASSIETPVIHYVKLSEAEETYCESLEPIGEADDVTEVEGELQKASDIEWELEGCSLIFPRGHDGEILLGYGFQADQVVSEGHFTNMISAASPSESSSDASSYQSEDEKATNRRNSDTSFESDTARYDYQKKRIVMASVEHFNKRRITNLHLAYGIPHGAQDPDQLRHSMPLRFATCDEAPGLLDQFNADYEAKRHELEHSGE
ncbi:hypothetical protein J4E85_007133 [Alternaria conjuncta]|uniref:uncharacterized protein n=1 Tax=Alternaria conjuncta TaxID=181017 RepID=UPI00222067F1|nr:uncharacterized protein J4E85_007133 [Alternaria conjuncta]KAI4925256.1 hypothetical protein J4E85_007133 [Alternaria conjuncta]